MHWWQSRTRRAASFRRCLTIDQKQIQIRMNTQSKQGNLMPKVEITQGPIEGIDGVGVIEYRGVPFAAPATGDLRFRAPRAPQPWQGSFRAERRAPAALQEKNPVMGIEDRASDCLYLNLWVPEGQGPFPVMVWFHGGGYLSGSPSQALYDGARLAREQRVIVVNAAYRLGFCGYGWLRELAPELESEGNLGLRDQVAALEWVRENIGAFGGDAARVTVFGESAGGFSVATLMATPAAHGLFQRAICQSGAGDMVVTPEEATRISALVVDALAGEGAPADRLRQASDRDLIRAQRHALRNTVARGLRDTTPQFGMVFMPVVDGDFLPEMPVNAVARGAAREIELLAGVCRDEWQLFQYAPPFNGGHALKRLRDIGASELDKRFRRALPEHGEEALALYRDRVIPDERRGPLDIYCAMETDRLFRVPTRRLLDAQASAGGRAHGFQFTHEVDAFGVPLGACHVVDVPLVFNLIDTPVGQLFTGGDETAVALAREVSGLWGAFAHGEPPPWPDWSTDATARCFGPGDFATFPDASLEDLWKRVIP